MKDKEVIEENEEENGKKLLQTDTGYPPTQYKMKRSNTPRYHSALAALFRPRRAWFNLTLLQAHWVH